MTELRRTGVTEKRNQSTEAGVKFTTFIPMRIVRHRSNKVIVQPGAEGGAKSGQGTAAAPTLVKALARALFWQQLLDTGRVANVAELAAAERIDRVRIQKTLKLARLAPELIEDIARGREPVGLSLEFFIRRELPNDWDAQRTAIVSLAR